MTTEVAGEETVYVVPLSLSSAVAAAAAFAEQSRAAKETMTSEIEDAVAEAVTAATEDSERAASTARARAEEAAADASRTADLAATVQAAVDSGLAVTYLAPTWTALAAIVPTEASIGAAVPTTDAGTHTDPVVGGTVPNEGLYSYSLSPAGWERIATNDISAVKTEVTNARSGAVDLKHRIDETARVPTEAVAVKRNARWRRSHVGLVNSVVDGAKTLAFGVDPETGATRMLAASIAGRGRRQGTDMVWPITDEAGQTIAGFDQEAYWNAVGLAVKANNPRRTGRSAFWEIKAPETHGGAVVFRVTSEGVDLVPAPSLMARLGGVAPDEPQVFGVAQRPSGGAVGWAEEVGFKPFPSIYAVIKGALGEMWLPQSAAPLTVIPFGGQSLGYHGGNTGVALDTAVYPMACGMTRPIATAIGDTPVAPGDVDGVAPASDAGMGGQRPQILVPFAIETLRRRADPTARPIGIVTTAAVWGGQPVSAFVRGGVIWANLMALSRRLEEIARTDFKRGVDCPAYVFLQGENGPAGEATYRAAFDAYVDDVLPELADQMGLDAPPVMIVEQPSTWVAAGATGVEQAILDASIERDDVHLAGPVYAYPIADIIHPDPIGKMQQAEMLALAWLEVKAGRKARPLRPSSIVRTGPTIDVAFHLPEGLPIDWGGDRVPAPTGATNPKGFSIFVDGVAVSLTSVEITGTDTVRIVCAGDPGPCELAIAMVPDADPAAGWVNARCLLFSPSASASVFAELGYDVPDPIRHWAVRGRWPVA